MVERAEYGSDEHRQKLSESVAKSLAEKHGIVVPEGHAWCSGHKTSHPVADFSKSASRKSGTQSCCKRWFNENYSKNAPARIRSAQERTVRVNYNLTLEEVEARIEAQGGVCAICSGPPNGQGRLHVDHSHTRGHNREMLDFTCNSDLGRLEKWIASGWLDKALAYLAAHGDLPEALSRWREEPPPLAESWLEDRAGVEREIAGAIKSSIDARGPITRGWSGSASKRVYESLMHRRRLARDGELGPRPTRELQ